jgi:hypothetical protein
MRVGDFGVEVVAADGGGVRELDSGHVLARPGQRYVLRLRNYGPLRCVVDVRLDGRPVTAGGLVIEPRSTVDLERPVHATERGRFTVVAEGDEAVFGPDGGRDNPELGLIEARFRRELPRGAERAPAWPWPAVTMPLPSSPPSPHWPSEPTILPPPRRPMAPPEWTPPGLRADAALGPASDGGARGERARSKPGGARPPSTYWSASALLTHDATITEPSAPGQVPDSVERAAGTGLTGHSRQEFVPTAVGELEAEATVIRLRLVIGSEAALQAARPLPTSESAPARPAARP